MRLLVTGGCGFLGAHVVEHFLKNTDATIVIIDKLTYASSGYDRLRDIDAFDDRRVSILGCDIAQPISPGITREVGAIDYVIHTAAETHVDNSIADPLPFIRSNVDGMHYLLWWLRDVPSLRRAFLVSTDECYGPASLDDKEHKFNEESRYRPRNPYAASKGSASCSLWRMHPRTRFHSRSSAR